MQEAKTRMLPNLYKYILRSLLQKKKMKFRSLTTHHSSNIVHYARIYSCFLYVATVENNDRLNKALKIP